MRYRGNRVECEVNALTAAETIVTIATVSGEGAGEGVE